MEKPSRRRLKRRRLLRFVHKAASFSVPSTPYSPARVHAHRAAVSGPVVPMIPAEARGRDAGDVGFEPTSPRVTCVGRVEFRKQDAGGGAKSGKERRAPWLSVLGGLFRRRARQGAGGGGDAGEDGFGPPPATGSAGTTPPSLGQMRRLGGGRATCRGFERRAPGAAKEKREWQQAEEPVEEEEEEGEEQVAVAAGSTAVEVVAVDGGVALEPRKEVNLWKRRAVAPPIMSLQVERGCG